MSSLTWTSGVVIATVSFISSRANSTLKSILTTGGASRRCSGQPGSAAQTQPETKGLEASLMQEGQNGGGSDEGDEFCVYLTFDLLVQNMESSTESQSVVFGVCFTF